MEQDRNPFVVYLESLRDDGDRGALAALRRGLGQPPGTVPAMYPYVVRFLPSNASRRDEDAYYLIASLFASHPKAGGKGNMGEHFAAARDPQGDNTALERRFTALLVAHAEDLPFYLRQAVSFLRSKEVPVDWDALLADVRQWHYDGGWVQKRWARAFWARRVPVTTADA